MRTILLIVLILLLIGAFPGWGYSSGWGYYPFGGIGLVLLIVLILALMGKLYRFPWSLGFPAAFSGWSPLAARLLKIPPSLVSAARSCGCYRSDTPSRG